MENKDGYVLKITEDSHIGYYMYGQDLVYIFSTKEEAEELAKELTEKEKELFGDSKITYTVELA